MPISGNMAGDRTTALRKCVGLLLMAYFNFTFVISTQEPQCSFTTSYWYRIDTLDGRSIRGLFPSVKTGSPRLTKNGRILVKLLKFYYFL